MRISSSVIGRISTGRTLRIACALDNYMRDSCEDIQHNGIQCNTFHSLHRHHRQACKPTVTVGIQHELIWAAGQPSSYITLPTPRR